MRRHRQSPWTNTLFSFAVPIAAGIGSIGITTLSFTALTYFILDTMIFAEIFTALSLGTGGVLSGYICGKYRRRRGLIDGLICGGVLALLLTASSQSITGTIPALWKPLLLTFTGITGGITGVNAPRPAKLM